ncbi:MAG: YegP family protein [Gallionellaceae bacterium]|jgi:uncharacterized protein YegP (UPF0339 family)|nr:YegP family protein [Gallionellaceae bacterium]
MSGKFVLNSSNDSQFYFVLKAGNGEVILTSAMYTTKASAENGILSVQANSPQDEKYERNVAKDGSPYFNLKAENHQVIGTSQMYSSEASRDNGIASVKNNGQTPTVEDNTIAL